MGPTTHQIEADIEDAREDLGSNLRELEQKVKAVTDWKHHFQTHPMTLLGVAFGGGVLLATTMGGRKSTPENGRFGYASATNSPAAANRETRQALEVWDNIKGALVAVAATRVTDFVSDVVPGFREQFQRAEKKTG